MTLYRIHIKPNLKSKQQNQFRLDFTKGKLDTNLRPWCVQTFAE